MKEDQVYCKKKIIFFILKIFINVVHNKNFKIKLEYYFIVNDAYCYNFCQIINKN